MKTYIFSKFTNDRQRSLIVIALRRAGFFAVRDADTLNTDASRTAIGLCWGNTMVVR